MEPVAVDLFRQSSESASTASIDEYASRLIGSTHDDGKACKICNSDAHGFHFGILACRACAAFFRRTVAENKIYKCRQNCSCPIRKGIHGNFQFITYNQF